jgi:uncharacterized protein (DUF1330 family)
MKYYAIAQLHITDPGWVAAYVEHVTPLVEAHGGRYLARTISQSHARSLQKFD